MWIYRFRNTNREWCTGESDGSIKKTSVNNCVSDECEIKCGVPQGSVLGPLFFILYVNDVQHALGQVGVRLYADDTVLYLSGVNKSEVDRDIQYNLNRFLRWCCSNMLTINPSKTKLMIFETRQAVKRNRSMHVEINETRIQTVPTYKYLGIVLDSTLYHRSHIAYVTKTILHKPRKYLTRDVALKMYKSMILPYMHYGVVYHTANSGDLEKLQRLQNRCLKVCLDLYKRHGTRDVQAVQCWTRREILMCVILCTRDKGQLVDERDVRTRAHDAPMFLVGHPNKETFKRSIQYAGAVTWNNLPIPVRNIED